MTAAEARHERPVWEVEGLLLSRLAQREVEREAGDQRIPIVENREGEAAPSWVEDLPVE